VLVREREAPGNREAVGAPTAEPPPQPPPTETPVEAPPVEAPPPAPPPEPTPPPAAIGRSVAFLAGADVYRVDDIENLADGEFILGWRFGISVYL